MSHMYICLNKWCNKRLSESYILAKYKKLSGGIAYQSKCKAWRKRFGNIIWRDDQKCDVLKIAMKMVKTNQDIIGEHCIRNDDVFTFSDVDKIAWKNYNEKHMNKEFVWDRHSISGRNSCKPHLIDVHYQELT